MSVASDDFYNSFTSEDIRRVVMQNRSLQKALYEAEERNKERVMLLYTALHELAIAVKAKDIPIFITRWQRLHRRRDDEGVPFA